jgi:hypothetical protein
VMMSSVLTGLAIIFLSCASSSADRTFLSGVSESKWFIMCGSARQNIVKSNVARMMRAVVQFMARDGGSGDFEMVDLVRVSKIPEALSDFEIQLSDS